MPRGDAIVQRTVHESPWFCAIWRGGCGADLREEHPEPAEPCPHCHVYAVTRYRLVDPEVEAA